MDDDLWSMILGLVSLYGIGWALLVLDLWTRQPEQGQHEQPLPSRHRNAA